MCQRHTRINNRKIVSHTHTDIHTHLLFILSLTLIFIVTTYLSLYQLCVCFFLTHTRVIHILSPLDNMVALYVFVSIVYIYIIYCCGVMVLERLRMCGLPLMRNHMKFEGKFIINKF